MHVLILGGTRFAGRAVTDAALDRGDTVTLFNRGRTNPGLYPQAETIIGDRTGDLTALSTRHWDAVVDVAAYDPEVVRRSAQALAGVADRYVFVSTVSVYADHGVRQVEGAPVIPLRADTPEDDRYGARKAAAEAIVTEAFGDRSLIVRAGLIVGPNDPTDRFAYWPRRIARGGRILAPGDPADPVQFIDVRDLGRWIIDGAREGLRGVFNVTGEPIPFGRLLGECVAGTGSRDAVLQWVPSARLLAAGVDPWMGVPLWVAAPGWEGANDVDVSRALAAGLRLRPVAETIRDTLAWDLARGGPEPGKEGLSREREEDLLRLLASRPTEPASLRELLRSRRVFPDTMPEFDPNAAPDDPVTLFLRWLEAAIQDAVPAPHAMTLATADDRGRPSSRVLICKDVDTDGHWYFASGAASGKGRDLAVNPGAALSFFWPLQGRQIRVRGTAVPAGGQASAADFLARPPASRAESLLGRQSEPLDDLADLDRAFREAHARVLADPELVAPAWTLYVLTAEEVEFWQGDPERRHVRLQYQRAGDGWTRQLLWP